MAIFYQQKIKIFCDEQSETEIDLISEVESCIYEIHINSHSLCSIPYFSKKQNKFDIKCHPVVDHTTYADYLKKKESLKGVERRAIRKETLNDVKEEASVTLSSTEPSIVKDLNYEELIEMVSNDQDLYDKTIETLNLDAEDLQGFNYEILNHNKELYRQLKEGGANPEELKTISDWLEKFERILDTNEKALDKESNLESEIADENVKEMEEALQSDHTNLDAQDLKGLNYQILNHNKELYRQLKEGGANPEELKTISDWLDKFERILDTTEKALDKESEITDEILKESDHPIQDLMNQIENQDLEKRNLKTKVDSSPKEADLNDVVDQLKDKNQQLADLKNLDLNKIRTVRLSN
jgi:ferritin